ncbi:MAG: 2-dehydro-3-deoxyphosphooctonate aldolase [Firmicutes bacterium HGW-Firmicutes-19]|jgi:uncharacterized protein (TIGR03581 family)|nr:MAG: 2-dehydro-3-deoxyphosphooctonate aldolase [Firmicutes bacterium HGW-Firmicutes-19]
MANWYKDQVCLNVLAKDVENAKEVYKVAEGHVLVGVLSANYDSVTSAVEDMKRYQNELDNNISVGLGGGNPAQWKMVAEISEILKPEHSNQIFSAVGYTRAKLGESGMINALVSPSGTPGMVKISTGPLSSKAIAAIIPVETAIAMIKEMGGNSVKYFPMKGLLTKDEYIAVAKACAKDDFMLEPTGGIDLSNFEEIVKIAKEAGVKRIIPHVYSSIMDEEGKTKVTDVGILMEIIKKIYRDC